MGQSKQSGFFDNRKPGSFEYCKNVEVQNVQFHDSKQNLPIIRPQSYHVSPFGASYSK